MGIPVMSFFPQVSSAPAPSENGPKNHDDGFASMLAVAGPKPVSGHKHESDDNSANAADAQKNAADQLQKLLGSLTDGKVDVRAPGLGLTNAQQEQLAAKLEKLLKSGDGAALLASLLAAGQPGLKATDVLALIKLLGTSAQGSISIDALQGNLHLLVQAIQTMASSGGKLTLVDAVRQLTSAKDAFAQQLAKALEPVPIDTGPPRAPDSGDEPRDVPESGNQASATAGSNGREMTVSQQETSPADGAAEEAGTGAQAPDTELLADVLQALVKAQNAEHNAGQAGKAGSANDQQAQGAPASAEASKAESDVPAAVVPQQIAADVPGGQTALQPSPSKDAVSDLAAAANQPFARHDAPELADAATDIAAAVTVTQVQPTTAQSSTGQDDAETNKEPDRQSVLSISSDDTTAVANPAVSLNPADQIHTGAAVQVPARAAIEQAVVDQVVQRAVIALRNGVQEFQIQLKPEFLGALELRVSVEDGVAVVKMSAESAATRQLIDANIGQLRQAFGTDDVRVEHVPHFGSSDQAWTFSGDGRHGFWHGQNPFDGSSRLPEAIPFGGEAEPEPEEALVGAAASGSGLGSEQLDPTMAPGIGGIDLKA